MFFDNVTGTDPTHVLNSDLFAPGPKTTHYRGAASKRAGRTKISEKTGATYVSQERGSYGSAYNNKGEYGISKRERELRKREDRNALLAADHRRAKQDEWIKWALEESEREIRAYDSRMGY